MHMMRQQAGFTQLHLFSIVLLIRSMMVPTFECVCVCVFSYVEAQLSVVK